jgi:cytochrome c oxidase assembly protein subunit 15
MSRLFQARSSRPVAIWLFSVAALVFLMVLIGGVTRLTDSGLSITEWKPVSGALPPLNARDWAEEFARYRQIPEYDQVNRGMTLESFKQIFWWEWIHRQLGRLIGLAFAAPFIVFLVRREIPRRLLAPCVALLALGALQGAVGWWMVSSGLSGRIDVLPERLAIHLGMALLIYIGLLWTGFEALDDGERTRPPKGWTAASFALLGLVYVQALLGGLVAGNRAGRIYTDWPLMNGDILAPVDTSGGALRAFLHDPALVQFDHRIGAYVLLVCASLYVFMAGRARMPDGVRLAAAVLAGVVWAQALLGIAALMNATPLWLGVAHQIGALVVLTTATFTAWRIRHSEERLFSFGIRSRGL